MGASEGAGGGVGVDCGVGSIVWVRRRNGSWWPGRILGQDELAASHLMSPRSGTPVKLLGREDASVDWYNLEKSKRVKAFRCGEFDACIERVESSQGILPKKREKYARREDAILHALELEKQQKSGVGTNSLSHKYSADFKKDLNRHSSYETHLKDDESIDFGESGDLKPQSHRKADVFSEEVSRSSLLNAQQCASGKLMYLESDNSKAMPRMRGLQDFGLCIAPSDRKASMAVACEGTKTVSVNNHVDVKFPDSVLHVGSVNSVGGDESPAADKRKRSHCGLTEEYLVKRRDRRRPLVQVLQNSAKLLAVHSLLADCETASVPGQEEKEHTGTICHVNRSRCMCSPADSSDCLDHAGCSSYQMQFSPTPVGCEDDLHQPDQVSVEDTSSELIKDNDTGSSERHSVDVDVDDGTTLLQDYTSFIAGSKNSGNHVRQGISTLGSQEQIRKINNDYETSISGCKVTILSNDKAAGAVHMGVSKWHMKGKRNTRNITKRSIEVSNGKFSVMSSDNCNSYLSRSVYERKKRGLYKIDQENSCGQGFNDKAEVLKYAYDEEEDDDGFFKKNSKTRLVRFGKCRYPSIIKAASRDHLVCGVTDTDDDSHEIFLPGLEANDSHHLAPTPYWVESDELLDKPFVHPPNVDMELPLVDVNLKVQASYHGEHVPLVSLMSRLNGKAIIGHPVHIDILEDGLTNLLFPRNAKRQDVKGVVEYAAPPHVWRTGRRTAMQRVPRPHPAASALEGEETELIPYSDREYSLFKKRCIAPTHPTGSLKSSSDHCRLTPGKSHKKLSQKGSLSSQKTRRLSSIAVEQKHGSMSIGAKHGRSAGVLLDGLIKPGGTMPPVTCVPVKVVFSRLLEAVGRPVSAGVTCRGQLSGLSVRNPS